MIFTIGVEAGESLHEKIRALNVPEANAFSVDGQVYIQFTVEPTTTIRGAIAAAIELLRNNHMKPVSVEPKGNDDLLN